jgi:hypothetical protein
LGMFKMVYSENRMKWIILILLYINSS